MVGGPCSPNTLNIWLKKGFLVQTGLLPNLALTLCSPTTLIYCGSAHTVPQGLCTCFPLPGTAPSTLVTELPLTQGLWIQDCKPVSTTFTFISDLPQTVLSFLGGLVIPYFAKKMWSVEINSSTSLILLWRNVSLGFHSAPIPYSFELSEKA